MKKFILSFVVFIACFTLVFGKVEAANSIEKNTAFITKTIQDKQYVYLKADYIQWFTGEKANAEALKDKDCPIIDGNCSTPDGYYIRNVNPKIRTIPLSPNVKIYMHTYQMEKTNKIKWNQKITIDQFNYLMQKPTERYRYMPFHLEIKNGFIVKITEQYTP